MPHFYILPENINQDVITVSGGEVHHILDVLHKKKGDEINLFDGKGNEYTAKIARVSGAGKKRVIVLERADDGAWSVVCLLRPELLPGGW